MSTPSVQHYSGDTQKIDYTPGSAVSAGDVVLLGNTVAMATQDISASKLGALEVGGVWKFTKSAGTGTAFTAGVRAYWDAANSVATITAGSNKTIGIAALAAGDSATTVYILSIPQV